MENIPVLTTAHYLLRGIRRSDAPCLFPFFSDRDTMKFITPHPAVSVKDVEVQILEDLELNTLEEQLDWVIETKHDFTVIGTFRFHKIDKWHRKAEMGAVIGAPFQKKGIMTEIMPAVLDYGFHKLGFNRIFGDIFASNEGSAKILQAYGFMKEGTLRQTDFDGHTFHDTVVYSLLKEDYLNKC